MRIRAIVVFAELAGLLILAGPGAAGATDACGAGTYTYTFTNNCTETIFVGQNGPGASSTPPQGGNWALAPTCATDDQCGSGQTCSKQAGDERGRCTCNLDSDCPGSAPCVSKRCSTVATFCMPQAWTSGVFWPRTGCVLNAASSTLTCATGQCGGSPRTQTGGQIDCGSAGSSQHGPTPPIVLFEPTTTPTSANYDVSLNNGYNVPMKVTPVGGSGNLCSFAGCTADLNVPGTSTSCPTNLVFKDPSGSGKAIGCYQPQDACLSSGAGPVVTPPAALSCSDTISKDAFGRAPASTTDCAGNAGGVVKFLDMYEAKNTSDPHLNSQATANGGTPTAFSLAGCPPGSEFATKFVSSGTCTSDTDCTIPGQSCSGGQCVATPPPGIGVCIGFVNGVLVPDWGCTAGNIGATCGQYQSTYTDALGYTCQAVEYSGGTTYPCVPSTVSGLGACNTQVASEGFYPGAGGLFNATWVQAGVKAGGGMTPYYETLRNACPAAYTWQYDDVSGGRSCAFGGQPSSGFNIDFCPFQVARPAIPALAAAVLPATRSVQVGRIASAFATIINTGSSAGVACSIKPSPGVAGAPFSYQTTNPSTNAPTGTPNTPVDIPASGSQTFVISFAPSAASPPRDVRLTFQCSNSAAAPAVSGLNTFLLSASDVPVPDIVALVETSSHDGIVNIPGPNGAAAFAVATANVGASGHIIASADTGDAQLPVTLSLCRTNSTTGACVTSVGPSVALQIDGGEMPTFGVFVQGNGRIPFDPAGSRVFVRLKEQGVTRGSTSTAVRTQEMSTSVASAAP